MPDSKFLSKIRRKVSQCLVSHEMLADGDHVLVGLSGGKDSWALLALLADLQPRSPIKYSLTAVTIDGGLTGFDAKEMEETCQSLSVPFVVDRQKIFEIVADKRDEGSTFCSMCAKLRRGALYSVAKRLGATKIALGHHLDDAIETLLLNLFYGGRLAALPPVLLSNAGHVPILRPLLQLSEQELSDYVRVKGFRAVGCNCPICPTHPEHEHSDLKRVEMKRWIAEIAKTHPRLREHACSALKKLEVSRFLDPGFSEKASAVLYGQDQSGEE